MKVLLSAYHCSPVGGSEFGVGWDSACALAEHHDVIVLTRPAFRAAIEAELERQPRSNLSFVYFDLPASVQRFGFGDPFKPTQFYYILWQRGILPVAREILAQHDIAIIHHVTFVKYWAPSFLATLPRPFVWGPVGGGEVAPPAFWKGFSLRGKIYELLRDGARFLQELNPSVRRTARRAAVALATSAQTADRIRKIGAGSVEVYPAIGMPADEVRMLENIRSLDPNVFRFVSIGRLLHWKGFHLGISAFARAAIPDAEYWIVGDGPERERLMALADRLGVADRVRFWGQLPRDKTLQKLARSNVLVHPSLHESGGGVCLEAMSSGCPVICLDIGGPGVLVDESSGILVEATNPVSTETKLAEAMKHMAADRDRCARMGEAGRRRVVENFLWRNKAQHYSAIYQKIVNRAAAGTAQAD